MNAIRITVARTRGSVPREAGTSMWVTADAISGTIGGGALEWQAMRIARDMLAQGEGASERVLPLGPALGQCCGGAVTLRFEAQPDCPQTVSGRPLWVWGAGHVGRALVEVLSPLPEFSLTCIDQRADMLPDLPDVASVHAATPTQLVPHAPRGTTHFIVTHDHELDLSLCDALLRADAHDIGLIGSATKWARFRKRLQALGHRTERIARITCPIGDPSLGKHPQAVAIGVAHMLLNTAMTDRQEQTA